MEKQLSENHRPVRVGKPGPSTGSGQRESGRGLRAEPEVPPPAGECWWGSSRWPKDPQDKPPHKPHPAAQRPLSTVVTRGFSECRPHPPTEKRCLRKTSVMKDIQLQNGHLRNHKANRKHSFSHSR